MIGNIKGIIDKVASRKLGVTAVAGAAAATGVVEVKKKPPSHPSGGGVASKAVLTSAP